MPHLASHCEVRHPSAKAGDSDIEIALLTGAGLIGPGTVIVTTVPTRCKSSTAHCRRSGMISAST